MKCYVALCNNKQIISRKASSGEISFHKFPRALKSHSAWLQALGKQDSPPRGAVVCSQHFLAEDFTVNRSGLKKLKPGVVPFVINDVEKYMEAELQGNVIKNERIESMGINDDTLIKREPLDYESVETSCNIYDSFFEVVKHELHQQNSGTEHFDDKILIKHIGSVAQPATNSDILLHVLEGSTVTDEASVKTEPSLLAWDSIDAVTEVKNKDSTDCIVKDATREENGSLNNGLSELNVPYIRYNNISQHRLPISNIKHSTQSFVGNVTSRKHSTHYICDVCQREYKRRTSLVKHIKSHKQGKFITSKMCPFKSKYVCFKQHSRAHLGETAFVCRVCSRTFKCKGHLSRHMQQHTGAKRFACRLCPFKSIDNFALNQHMRCHTGERPYVCKICHYKFTQKYNLTRHMLTHTGETPFECDYCHHRFAQKYDLVSHFRTHAKKKNEMCFICDICSLVYSLKKSLLRHMQIRHPRHFQVIRLQVSPLKLRLLPC